MTSILAPLGYSPDEFLYGLKTAGLVDRVVILGGPVVRDPDSPGETYDQHEAALEEVENTLRERGVAVEIVRMDEPFGFADWVLRIRELMDQELDRNRASRSPESFPGLTTVAADISSGPAGLQSACTVAAVIEGIPVHIANKDSDRDIWLPLLDIPYTEILGDRKTEILDLLSGHEPMTADELADALGLSRSTVGTHTTSLETQGLIKSERDDDGRTKLWYLTDSGRILI